MAVAAKEAPHKAGPREWISLTVIALPCVLYSMDLTVLHLAVPQLSAQLQPSSAELVWILDVYRRLRILPRQGFKDSRILSKLFREGLAGSRR
jgi:hypothetical protein